MPKIIKNCRFRKEPYFIEVKLRKTFFRIYEKADDIPLIKKYLDKKEMKKFPNESQIREVKNCSNGGF